MMNKLRRCPIQERVMGIEEGVRMLEGVEEEDKQENYGIYLILA